MVRLTFALCLALFAQLALASVESRVSSQRVYDDDAFSLTVTVSPAGELSEQDIAALELLFNIERRSRQQVTQIVNGRRSQRVEFGFRLRPKGAGQFIIPAFIVNNEQSLPIIINVLDSTTRPTSVNQDDVIFNATLSTQNPYVGQRFYIALSLAYRIRLEGDIAGVDLPDFDSEVIASNTTQQTVNGVLYEVFQQKIALTAKNEGTFTLPILSFNGQTPNRATNRYERVTRRADLGTLTVKGIPANYPADAFWLPANRLTLTDNLNPQPSLETGDYLDWQITLKAEGLNAQQLPNPFNQLSTPWPNEVRTYENAPQFNDQTRTDTLAINANRPGQYTLPEVSIPWWNVETDTLEILNLPDRTLTVTGAPLVSAPPEITDFENVTEDIESSTNLTESPQTGNGLSTILGVVLLASSAFAIAILFVLGKRKWQAAREIETNDVIEPSTIDNPETLYPLLLKNMTAKGLNKNALSERGLSTFKALEAYLFSTKTTQKAAPTQSELEGLVNEVTSKQRKKNKHSGEAFELYPT